MVCNVVQLSDVRSGKKRIQVEALHTLHEVLQDGWRNTQPFNIGDVAFQVNMTPGTWRRALLRAKQNRILDTLFWVPLTLLILLTVLLAVLGYIALWSVAAPIALHDGGAHLWATFALLVLIVLMFGGTMLEWYVHRIAEWNSTAPEDDFRRDSRIQILNTGPSRCSVWASYTSWKSRRTFCIVTLMVDGILVEKLHLEKTV